MILNKWKKLIGTFCLIAILAFGISSCGSTPTDQEIIEEYVVKCFAENSIYKKAVENAYRELAAPEISQGFRNIDLYLGSDSTNAGKVQYIQSLQAEGNECAYQAHFTQFGQLCVEFAYINKEKKFLLIE